MEIRELTEKDLTDYQSDIIRYICDNLMINLPFISEIEKLAEEKYLDIVRFKKDGSAILYGVFEGKMLGFLWAYEREVFGEKRLHLDHLIVDANVRATGIGSKLIEKLYDIALVRNVSKIELMATMSNENAVNFYRKHGYDIKRVQMEIEVEN